MRILIAPNCFKECADAITIAQTIQKELQEYLPEAELETLPVSDGGDGFLAVCAQAKSLHIHSASVPRIYGNEWSNVPYGIDSDGKTAFIESAQVVGLSGTPHKFRAPLYLSSLSLGVLLKTIVHDNPSLGKIVIGLGGTAINDLGLGCAGAFGLQILDQNGGSLPIVPDSFIESYAILLPDEKFPVHIELVTDVQADLLGPNGTSRLFSPQKGATPDDVEKLESGFSNILRILELGSHLSFGDIKIGAAGGIGLGISLFSDFKLIHADEFMNGYLSLKDHISKADFIITAEGSYDSQSTLQKAPQVILSEAYKMGKQGALIAGKSSISDETLPFRIFTLSNYFNSAEESIKEFKKGIKFVCRELINSIQKSL
jgi:glycerate kinase